MSGIAGIVHFTGSPPDRDQAHQLSAGIAHRGPDDKGFFAEGPAALVHRRFAVAHSEPTQPVVGDNAVLVADGRWAEVDAAGVLAAWERAGLEGVGTLDGNHALALWERHASVLWLVRGPVGSRPLFWARDGDKVGFCSEMPPLLRLPWVSREIATDHLAEYLSFRYVHAPRTLYRDISAVPPGHAVRLDASGARVVRWWSPRWAPPDTPPPETEDLVRSVDTSLHRAVQRCTMGDVPVGILLSGGLDSSAILHHARRFIERPRTFTVAFTDSAADESSFAARVAQVMEADHQIVRISSRELVDHIDSCTQAMGQPLTAGAAVLQFLLFRELRSQVRVVLSGDGGDEVMGGRGMDHIAQRLRRSRAVGTLPGPARLLARHGARAAGATDLAVPHQQFGLERLIGGSQVFRSHERVAVLSDPAMVRPGIRRTLLEPLYQEVETDPLNAILHVWQRGWLPEDSLTRSDRMSARAGIEVRYPMLDRGMLSMSCLTPGPVKVQRKGLGYVTKWPLRLAMEAHMPKQVLNRPKRSLPNPLDRWLRGPGAAFLRERTEGLLEASEGLWVPREVRRLTQEHMDGTRNHGLKLWTLVLFGAWRAA